MVAQNSATGQWETEQLRITSFLAKPIGSEVNGWWERITATAPDQVTSQPKAGVYAAQGVVQGAHLSLEAAGNIIHWRIGPIVTPEVTENRPTIGNLATSIPRAASLANAWLALAPSMTRLGFGLVLMQSCKTHREAYEILGRYLHQVRISGDSTDFLYRINRRRQVTVGGLQIEINRLSSWSAIKWSMVYAAMQPDGRILAGDPLGFAARVDIDVNTAPEYQAELSSVTTVPLFGQLAQIASEIAEKGDTP